jgi:hypothetical protein
MPKHRVDIRAVDANVGERRSDTFEDLPGGEPLVTESVQSDPLALRLVEPRPAGAALVQLLDSRPAVRPLLFFFVGLTVIRLDDFVGRPVRFERFAIFEAPAGRGLRVECHCAGDRRSKRRLVIAVEQGRSDRDLVGGGERGLPRGSYRSDCFSRKAVPRLPSTAWT